MKIVHKRQNIKDATEAACVPFPNPTSFPPSLEIITIMNLLSIIPKDFGSFYSFIIYAHIH